MLNRKVLIFGVSLMSIVFVLAATKSDTLTKLRNIELIPDHDTNPSLLENEDISKANTIQLALLLDTSGSMDGLIEQAKSQLWDILNTMVHIEKGDQETELEIALYEYGNPNKATSPMYISKITDFTTDVDLISEKLFSLATNGGEEYCGAVIQNTLESLEWTNGDQLRMIYIAGNESFAQGPINYLKSCKVAKENNVFINTIFCGDKATGKDLQWEQGANLAGGQFLNIEQNQVTEYVSTPFDDQINRLNASLNQTYIPYGEKGREKYTNQRIQDSNANSYGKENYRKRSIYKSSKKYKADDWDLVDAYKKDKNILNNKELLQEEQANMTIEELERQIEGASVERDSIKKEIQSLSRKANDYKVEFKKKASKNHISTLEAQVIIAIKSQAEARGYQLKEQS